MNDRPTLDQMTSNDLDALHERAEKAEADANHNADLVAEAVQRAERAEAAIARVRHIEQRLWQADDSRQMPVSAVCHSIANDLRAALDEPAPASSGPAVRRYPDELREKADTDELTIHPPARATTPCVGFPDRCANPVDVPAQSPYHGGGIRCGCTTPKEA